MSEFARYERLRDAGATPQEIDSAGRADGLDPVALIRLLRMVCGLTLAQAKKLHDRTPGADEEILRRQLEEALKLLPDDAAIGRPGG